MSGEFGRGQAQNGVNLEFRVKVELDPPNNRDNDQVVLQFYSNLLALAWTVDELSRGQARDWRTHGHTHTYTHTHVATTIPEGQNWPRVKTITNVLA